MKKTILYLMCFNFWLIAQNSTNITNTDPLSETPLYPIPSEMSFEEYQDMNRRLSQAFLWSSIPIPGITHYYAGEKKIAKRLFYIGLGGSICVISGFLSMKEGDWPEYNENIHVIHNQGSDEERWYERIPVSVEGDNIHYKLNEIYKKQSGNGGGLIAIGIAIIIGDFLYDRIRGLHIIEEKRNQVRFKYGKQLKFSYKPNIYFSNYNNIFGMNFQFDLF